MAYNNQFPVGYQQYVPQYQQNYQQAYQPAQQNGLTWVQGESGAKSFFVPANGTVMLMDSEQDQFFIKSSDASGMPLPLRTFTYKEITNSAHTNQPSVQKEVNTYATKDEIEELRREIDELRKESEAHG